jgi:hypothetical protein
MEVCRVCGAMGQRPRCHCVRSGVSPADVGHRRVANDIPDGERGTDIGQQYFRGCSFSRGSAASSQTPL